MYETRDDVRMAQKVYGFGLAFIGATPSVELMHEAENKAIGYKAMGAKALPKLAVIDLTTYKFLDKGILSPPARNAIESNIKAGRKTLIISNRRGSYSVTRCVSCGDVLKCPRCDSAVTYSRSQKQFGCFTVKLHRQFRIYSSSLKHKHHAREHSPLLRAFRRGPSFARDRSRAA